MKGVDFVKKDERDFYIWLHNTLKIKQKKEKVRAQVNSSMIDGIAAKIAKVEAEIAKSEEDKALDKMNYEPVEYEIDFGTTQTVKINYKAQELRREAQDEIFQVFAKMRNIGKVEPRGYHFEEFYTHQFCEQAKYMKDFEDDYDGYANFSAFRPIYAYMNNQQMRTYFTWRTNLKNGHVLNTVSKISIHFFIIFTVTRPQF